MSAKEDGEEPSKAAQKKADKIEDLIFDAAVIETFLTKMTWPAAAVIIAIILKDVLNDDDEKPAPQPSTPQPRKIASERHRNPHPPAPTYPPRN